MEHSSKTHPAAEVNEGAISAFNASKPKQAIFDGRPAVNEGFVGFFWVGS